MPLREIEALQQKLATLRSQREAQLAEITARKESLMAAQNDLKDIEGAIGGISAALYHEIQDSNVSAGETVT